MSINKFSDVATRRPLTLNAEFDDVLRDKSLYVSQWLIARNVRDIGSRRDWPTQMSLVFVRHRHVGLCYRDGSPYELPDIDEVFGDSPDFKWFSDYLLCDGSNVYPRHVSTKTERLRLINLFLKLRYPQCCDALSP